MLREGKLLDAGDCPALMRLGLDDVRWKLTRLISRIFKHFLVVEPVETRPRAMLRERKPLGIRLEVHWNL